MEKIVKSDAEWHAEMSPQAYQICRLKGTEPAFSGRYWDHKETGQYQCACCGAELFGSQHKFDSGTGWPSFTAPLVPEHVATELDASHGMVRQEAQCARCDAHLGHVFDDGPPSAGGRPGKRYCINSASLQFIRSK